ncbi:MAG: PucR family transcriptional regulator [Acidimicrobiales bacterium]
MSLDRLCDVMAERYRMEIPAYREISDPAMLADVRGATRAHVEAILTSAVGDDHSFDDAMVEELRSFGERRGAQGFALEGVLRAYQVGTGVAWRFILDELGTLDLAPGVANEVVATVSVSILEATTKFAEVVAEGFSASDREQAARHERIRRDCFDALLRDGGDPHLAQWATAAGIHLGEAHAVMTVLFDGDDGDDGDDGEPGIDGAMCNASVEQATSALAAGLAEVRMRGVSPSMDIRSGQVCAVFVVAPGTNGAELADRLDAALCAVVLPASVTARAALGQVELGIDGIARSYRQATRALAVAPLASSGALCLRRYGEALPELVAGADRSLAFELYRQGYEPLAAADGRDANSGLVVTLETYFECGRNLMATARRLYLHRHTVAARLSRIEALTSRCLSNRRDCLVLELALASARSLHAPMLPEGTGRRFPSTEMGALDSPARSRPPAEDSEWGMSAR